MYNTAGTGDVTYNHVCSLTTGCRCKDCLVSDTASCPGNFDEYGNEVSGVEYREIKKQPAKWKRKYKRSVPSWQR